MASCQRAIEKGKDADLVVIHGDPLAHIDDHAKVVTTVKGRVVYPSAPLYASVGARPASDFSFLLGAREPYASET